MPEAEFPQNAPAAFEVPRHVAIIMDGNGRWAAARGLPRAEGHRRGVEALRRTIRAAGEIGIKFVTIFSFSAENWSRPASEIGELMGLLRRFVRNDLAELHKSNVRVRVIGERDGLDADIGRLLIEAEELTKDNDGLTLVVAFNYGARQEIVRAVRRIAEALAQGSVKADDIDMDAFSRFLDAPDIPDPDLIIRTSGEQRLSNFLLWQSAYSELVFVPTYWPDFDRATLETAIREYQQRERRFGGLVAQTGASYSLRCGARAAGASCGLSWRRAVHDILDCGRTRCALGMDHDGCRSVLSVDVFFLRRRYCSGRIRRVARPSDCGIDDGWPWRACRRNLCTARTTIVGDRRHRLCGSAALGSNVSACR